MSLALVRACALCGEPLDGRGPSVRCEDCAGVELRASEVHPTLPWDRDPTCRAWVAERPDGATLEQVGQALGVTRERVRQIETRALARLATALTKLGVDPADVAGMLAGRGRGTEHMVGGGNGRATPVTFPVQLERERRRADALPEELWSPLGRRAEEALRAAEERIELVAELVRRAECHDRGDDPGAWVVKLAAARQARAEEEETMAAPKKLVTYDGETLGIAEWATRLGVSRSTVSHRLAHGQNPDGTLTDARLAGVQAPPKKAAKAKVRRERERPVEHGDVAPVDEARLPLDAVLTFGSYQLVRTQELPDGALLVMVR